MDTIRTKYREIPSPGLEMEFGDIQTYTLIRIHKQNVDLKACILNLVPIKIGRKDDFGMLSGLLVPIIC